MNELFEKSVCTLTGVGEKRAAQLAKLGIVTLYDLLLHLPRHYEDWSVQIPLRDAPRGEPCCVRATADGSAKEQFIRKGMVLYKFMAVDEQGTPLYVTLFNNPYLAKIIRRGETYLFYGEVTRGAHPFEMASPEIEPAAAAPHICPLYPLTQGMTSRMLQGLVRHALEALDTALDADPLPGFVREQYGLCPRRFALTNIHFPADHAALAKARRRLAFEELFLLQIGLLRLKEGTKQQAGEPILLDIKDEYVKLLPFTLTRAQQRALDEGLSDMRGAHPMNRLLQGDVGSGKTAVAAGLLYTAVRGGRQAAFMAPTEILAMQHAESLKWLPVRAGLLLGSTPPAAKKRLREALAAGEIDLVIGTHALLSEGVEYKDLGLVVTDEQHRFGVRQRAALADKGDNPHRLVMSATPIPRSLALIVYGDLDISVLDELPPGRTPVETYAVGSDKRQRAYNYIKKHLDGGRQGFLVCPLIEDTGGGELLSAQALFKDLQQGAFKGYRLGLLHGRMKAADKDAVMAAFAAGEVQLLISTTVIEVGIDVPNAVIMVIENADRFGLAQLHQLRGRVGRGAAASTCILISDAQGEEAKQRLRILCTTNDGFRIAEEDLRLRGPGDFFGNRQHGLPLLKIADLVSDMPLLRDAQQAARKLLDADFELNGFPALRGEMEKMFQRAAV